MTNGFLFKKLWRHRSFRIGLIVIFFLLLAACLGPVFWTIEPTSMQMRFRFKPPSLDFPLGTDGFGRDVLSRLLHGARLSLGIGLSVAVLSGAMGTLVGVVSGHFKQFDSLLMRCMDMAALSITTYPRSSMRKKQLVLMWMASFCYVPVRGVKLAP
jgi:peptide/nickel transport system permease protein